MRMLKRFAKLDFRKRNDMGNEKKPSKVKLAQAIFYAISAMILAVLAIVKWMFQDDAPNLMQVGLIIAFWRYGNK